MDKCLSSFGKSRLAEEPVWSVLPPQEHGTLTAQEFAIHHVFSYYLLSLCTVRTTYYVPVERASLEILNSHASPFVTVLCVQLCTTTKTKQSADLH